MPRQWMFNRLYASSECVHLLCAGLGSLLNALIRLPFALVFGWPDPAQQQATAMALAASQIAELEAEAERQARASEPSDN